MEKSANWVFSAVTHIGKNTKHFMAKVVATLVDEAITAGLVIIRSAVQGFFFAVGVALFLLFFSMSHAQAQEGGNRYGADQVLKSGSTQIGLVVQVEVKEADASPTSRGVGASIGAAVGGLMAANSGSSSWGKNALGAMLGGLAGERISNVVSRAKAQEVVVLVGSEERPTMIVVVMPEPYTELVEGQRVLVTNIAQKIRVIPYNGAQRWQ